MNGNILKTPLFRTIIVRKNEVRSLLAGDLGGQCPQCQGTMCPAHGSPTSRWATCLGALRSDLDSGRRKMVGGGVAFWLSDEAEVRREVEIRRAAGGEGGRAGWGWREAAALPGGGWPRAWSGAASRRPRSRRRGHCRRWGVRSRRCAAPPPPSALPRDHPPPPPRCYLAPPVYLAAP